MGPFRKFAKFLRREPEEPSVDHLANVLLHDESNDARYAAAVKLGELGDATAVPALYQAAKEHHSRVTETGVRYVQVAATEALGEIGGPEATEALVKLVRLTSGYGAAGEALKKLGAHDILRRYLRFRNQRWACALILDENGNIHHWETTSMEKPPRIGPGDYSRVEYSIGEVEPILQEHGSFRGIPSDTPHGPSPGTQYLGIVDLEPRRLHLETPFDGFSTIDLAGDPAELLPAQKKAFVRFFRRKYGWFRVTKKVGKLLQ